MRIATSSVLDQIGEKKQQLYFEVPKVESLPMYSPVYCCIKPTLYCTFQHKTLYKHVSDPSLTQFTLFPSLFFSSQSEK